MSEAEERSGVRRSNNRQTQSDTTRTSASTARRSAGSSMLGRGRSKMRHSATNSGNIKSSSSSSPVSGSVASAARRRSSREVMVDMKAMLLEVEAEADLRGTFARSKGQSGSCSSLVSSVDDHPLMDLLDDNNTELRGNNIDDSHSVGDIDQMLSDANRGRLNRHRAEGSARNPSSRHLSGNTDSRSLDGSSISGLAGPGMTSRMSTRTTDSRSLDGSSISGLTGPGMTSRMSTRNLRSRINLKVELSSIKADNEILQSKTRVLTEENCMLRTELCSTKASEAKLKQMVANLEKQVGLLKKQSSAQEREGSYRRRGSNTSTGSGFIALSKAVETLLGSEINGAKDCDYQVPLGASVSMPLNTGREQTTPSLAQRLCHSLSKESLDDGQLNFEECLTSENHAAQEEQARPSRPRRARRRESSSSTFSVDDAATVQCELNNLADDNDALREKNAVLEAERNRLRERLDQMMAVSAATASAVPTHMGAIGDNSESELYGKDFEQAYNESAEPRAPPSSIRDIMTMVSSIRNNINGSNPTTAQGPAGYHRSNSSNSRGSSLTPSRLASIDTIADSMLSVDSLLWDSFNDDGAGHANYSRGAGNAASFTYVPEIDDEHINRQEAGATTDSHRTSTNDEEGSTSIGLVERDDRLGLDDYHAYAA